MMRHAHRRERANNEFTLLLEESVLPQKIDALVSLLLPSHSLKTMTSYPLARLLVFLLVGIQLTVTVVPRESLIHHCQVESFTDTIRLGDCLPGPIPIETTRCRGQCHSEDSLVYDWQYAPTYYRHQRRMTCCSPNHTIPYETRIMCDNHQLRTLQYRIITRCDCRACSDKCVE